MDQLDKSPWGLLFRTWGKRGISFSMFGWGISLLFHLILAFIFLKSVQAPAEISSDHPVPQTQLASSAPPLHLTPPAPAAESASPTRAMMASTAAAALPTIFSVEGDSGVPTIINEPSPTVLGGPAPQNTVSFCNTVNEGKYVAFMVDRSGSMIMAHEYVRQQLNLSISRLKPYHYYTIIYYADDQPLCLAKDYLLRASASNRQRGMEFADTVNLAEVKTTNQAWQAVNNALHLAFDLATPGGEEIELLYWLTDGEFDHDKVWDTLVRRQQQRKTAMTINVVGCGSRDNEAFLQKIARFYNGQYRFVTEEEMIQSLR